MGGFEAKLVLYLLNERVTSNRDRFRPAIIAARQSVLQTLLNPLAVRSLKMFQIRKPAQLAQALYVDDGVTFRRLLDLAKTALLPPLSMIHHAGPYHVQVDVRQAAMQMLIGFNGCSMIAIFPERALLTFPLVIFLRSAPGDE